MKRNLNFKKMGSDFLKNKKLCIRISENLLEIVHMKAKKANMTLTDYVTFACLEKQIFVIDGLDKVLKELKAIGRNINQLTVLANMDRIEVVNLSELTNQYAMVSSMLNDLLERKRWKG